MSLYKYNPYILRRTPTPVDITRLQEFIDTPIYLELRDKQELFGELAAIEEDGNVLFVRSDRPPVCNHLEETIALKVVDNGYRVDRTTIICTYFGPIVKLKAAHKQWNNNRNSPPFHLRINATRVNKATLPKVPMEDVNEIIFMPSPMDSVMDAIGRYLAGETTTVDQALGLVHKTPGNPNESRNPDLNKSCWHVFILTELIDPPLKFPGSVAQVKGAANTQAFRDDLARRKGDLLSRALEFSKKHGVDFPIKNPSSLPRNSKDRKDAEALLEKLQNFF